MSQATTQDLYKVDNIWFDDGNLIVIAQPKVFRLYQGLLARRSPVFTDMLSIPQPDASIAIDEADRRIVDALGLDITGCAVVRFTDKPQEVESFLSAFLHDSQKHSSNTSALTGVLRLATKYEVAFLRKWAVECLEKLYPFSITPDAEELRLPWWRMVNKTDEWYHGMFPLIDVAMTAGVPWVLPDVLWRLRRLIRNSILYLPEWDEFPEERKKKFLVALEHQCEIEFRAFDFVLSQHREGMVHIINVGCEESFKKALHVAVAQKGSGASDDALWVNYMDGMACSECKQRYAQKRRDVIVDQFLALQRGNGLPEPAEMMVLREKFYQEVTMRE